MQPIGENSRGLLATLVLVTQTGQCLSATDASTGAATLALLYTVLQEVHSREEQPSSSQRLLKHQGRGTEAKQLEHRPQ